MSRMFSTSFASARAAAPSRPRPQRALDENTLVTLFQPDGPGTPAWLLTSNYRVILEYNCSNYYAMSVGLLADEIAN